MTMVTGARLAVGWNTEIRMTSAGTPMICLASSITETDTPIATIKKMLRKIQRTMRDISCHE